MKKLVGGDELFSHPAVLNFYNEVIDEWDNGRKPVALLLGCTLHKPYSKSFMHKKIIAILKKYDFDEKVQQLIVGEPLVVCPREWENKYPAAHYEFPPDKLGEEGKRIFIIRLRDFFRKFNDRYHKFILFAPNHHKKIVIEACEELIEPITVPYNVFYLPKLREAIETYANENNI